MSFLDINPMFDRALWLLEKRRLAEERMNTLFAPSYDSQWGASIDPTHAATMRRFLDLCPRPSLILDAGCGTGKYWPMLSEAGVEWWGADQSAVMLAQAHAKFPGAPIAHLGLQELRYLSSGMLDGIICMDVMEVVFPEDWPLVLGNFRALLKSDGIVYLTVELLGEAEIDAAYEAGKTLGQPLIRGEYTLEGGYHYYPPESQVRGWLAGARFAILEDLIGDGYHHYLCKCQS